jgi:hypothetical protein
MFMILPFVPGNIMRAPYPVKSRGHFPVMNILTILPKIVIPKIMPVTIARKIAKNRVNLKSRKKRGNKIMHNIIVKQPVAKSFVSNMRAAPCLFPFRESLLQIIPEAG